MAKSKLPAELGQALIESESAVPKPEKKPAVRKQPSPKKSGGKKTQAVLEAERIAQERYGLTKAKPKSPAERQRDLRERFVPVSVMLTPAQKAKLDAVVVESETDLTNYIRDWIDELPEPRAT